MNKYTFNVKLLGNVTMEVVAPNKEEAKRILEDTMNSINLKDLKGKETSREDTTIKNSDVNYKFNEIKERTR